MTWLDFVTLTLAVHVPINAWLHEGGLFEEWVEWIRVWGEFVHTNAVPQPRFREHVRKRIAQLLTCRFCLSHHVPWILLLTFYIWSFWLISPWSLIVKLPIYSLAATRLSLMLEFLTGDRNDRESTRDPAGRPAS